MSSFDKQVGGDHYKEMSMQPFEFIERNGLGYGVGNIIKYLCRFNKKGGLDDLKKAKHYLELMIELENKYKKSKMKKIRNMEGKKYDTKTFIEKAKAMHGDKYCYDKVKYVNSRRKVTIVCPEHGSFPQAANGHLRGFGCPVCGGTKPGKNNSLAAKFPDIAKEWHPTKNGSKSPEDFTYGSGKKVWWQCEKGHQWKVSINYRTNKSNAKNGSCKICKRLEKEKQEGQRENTDTWASGWDANGSPINKG